MKIFGKLVPVILTSLIVSGCTQTTSNQAGNQEVSLTQSPTQSVSQPSAAEQACIAAVSKETNNSEVTAISSELFEGGTKVKVGVGTQRAPWNCVAHADGSTDGIISLTNEGAL